MRTAVLASAVLLSAAAEAREHWSVEAFAGEAFNFRSRLRIEQDGGFSESVAADYKTRGLRSPLYYMVRGARWKDERAWEASLIHHKIYLTNPPSGVSDVSVSHGYNMVTLNRAFRRDDWTWRVGAGPVITHAEATINGTRYDGPYKLSGAALLAGAGRRFYLSGSTYVAAEGLFTAAYAAPKLSGTPAAELKVPNFAVHGVIGLGRDF